MKNILVIILMLISINVFSQSRTLEQIVESSKQRYLTDFIELTDSTMIMHPYWKVSLHNNDCCKPTVSRWSLDFTAGPNFPSYTTQNYEPGINGGLSIHYNLGNDFNLGLEERYTVNTAQKKFKTIYFNTILSGEYEIAFKHLSGGLLVNLGAGAFHLDESKWATDETLRIGWNVGAIAGTGFRVNFTEVVDVISRVRLNYVFGAEQSFLTTDIGLKFKF